MPRVSVIIPTYNCARYVAVAVESVLAQIYAGYELIVVDDGSTDETSKILQQYKDKLTYIYQENQERSAARNTGIRASTGEYVAFLDSDDIWLPTKLERQVSVLDQHPDVVLVYCKAAYIDETGNPVKFRGKWVDGEDSREVTVSDQARSLLLGNSVSGGGSTPMVRRTALAQVGLFDETLSYPEDWDLWARLSHTGPFAYIPEPLTCYRVYGWHKVLAIEASDSLVHQQVKVIDRTIAGWDENLEARDRLRAEALGMMYTRAALASFQLGLVLQGRSQLDEAVIVDPGLADRDALMRLVVDRAKLIETETGSYQEAEDFIRAVLTNLPERIPQHRGMVGEALSGLYVGGAFEQHARGDRAAVRSLLREAVAQSPTCLKNVGVVSVALEAWCGEVLTNSVRQVARMVADILGQSTDAMNGRHSEDTEP